MCRQLVSVRSLRARINFILTGGGALVERDSRKDEAVVFIFIIATVSLLAWALIKPFAAKWIEVRDRELLFGLLTVILMDF
jgi:hypothetical protein